MVLLVSDGDEDEDDINALTAGVDTAGVDTAEVDTAEVDDTKTTAEDTRCRALQ